GPRPDSRTRRNRSIPLVFHARWAVDACRARFAQVDREISHLRPVPPSGQDPTAARSEEHTSELQSRVDLVCRLLLEKKKVTTTTFSSAASQPFSTSVFFATVKLYIIRWIVPYIQSTYAEN